MSTIRKVGQAPFSCVKLAEADFKDKAAVYVILNVNDNGEWKVLDVGQSAEIGASIDTKSRVAAWKEQCDPAKIQVGSYSMPTASYKKEDRTALEQKVRKQYNPPCAHR
jgi:hypothetical protein